MEKFEFDAFDSYAKIVVIGVGGGGSNAVNQMLSEQIRGVTFWVCNTDAQALANSNCENRLVLGKNYTFGLGAGGDPDVGAAAAEASEDDIREIVMGANMVFIAGGMGGGTGTGAAPIVAKIAKESGALTIAVVTRPFAFEGEARKENAVKGITRLKDNVDTMIIVSNDRLMMMSGGVTVMDAFGAADRVLCQSIKTIIDLIVIHGIINVDFADVKATLSEKGMALIGFGQGKGQRKAIDAANEALSCPLLESSIQGAHSLLINVTVGKSVLLDETKEAVDYITNACGTNPNVIYGVRVNTELDDEILVSVIGSGFEGDFNAVEPPVVNTTPNARPVEEEEEEEEDILPSYLSK